MLEFALSPELAPRLARAAALAPHRNGRWRQGRVRVVWHDGADGELARDGLALAEQRGSWRLEKLVPNGAGDWPPAAPAPVLAEAASLAALGATVPDRLVPVGVFDGTERRLNLAAEAGRLVVWQGMLHGIAAQSAVCRVRLEGPAEIVAALARAVAQEVPLEVPGAGLAASAAAVAHGRPPSPRHLGAPAVASEGSAEQALEVMLIHLVDVVLHWARELATATGAEPVHQMRLALRRLRTALALLRTAADGPELATLAHALRDVARQLGVARDWDVFEAGAGAEVAAVFPEEPGMRRLRAAAARQRAASYAGLHSYFGGPAWRALAFDLALLPGLKPWRAAPGGQERLAVPVADFAGTALARRRRHLIAPGDSLSGLPADALHTLRKQAKRIRYTAELFAPLHPGKPARRFLRRLARLQDALGMVNDAAVAGALMQTLGRAGVHRHAAGLVQGYVAAGHDKSLSRADRAWKRVLRAAPFWP